jgi:hypothetical protein
MLNAFCRVCPLCGRRPRPALLYNRAVGYSYDAEKIFFGKDGKVTRVPRSFIPGLKPGTNT